MFSFKTAAFLGVLTATMLAVSSAQAQQVDLLGVGGRNNNNQNRPQVNIPQQAPQIKHKRVITVTTQVRHQDGRTSQVRWDFTTHTWNPSTNQWQELQWGQAYLRACHGLYQQGWTVTGASSGNGRTVTGTW